MNRPSVLTVGVLERGRLRCKATDRALSTSVPLDHAAVAQWTERRSPKAGSAGSTPADGSDVSPTSRPPGARPGVVSGELAAGRHGSDPAGSGARPLSV
jgi:hypothetical protein